MDVRAAGIAMRIFPEIKFLLMSALFVIFYGFIGEERRARRGRSQKPGVLCVSTVCLNILRARADQKEPSVLFRHQGSFVREV